MDDWSGLRRWQAGACALALLLAGGCQRQANSLAVNDSQQARVTAESAFLGATNYTVTQYSIELRPSASGKYAFAVDGAGRFAGPAAHWLVLVDAATGSAAVDPVPPDAGGHHMPARHSATPSDDRGNVPLSQGPAADNVR
jgi:hypothetical protein